MLLSALFLASPLALRAEPRLGRLFFSVEQRQALDRERLARAENGTQTAPAVTVNGVVTRSSGKATVWIDGIAHDERAETGGAVIAPSRDEPPQFTISLSGGRKASAPVGAAVDARTARTYDLIGAGRLEVGSRAVSEK